MCARVCVSLFVSVCVYMCVSELCVRVRAGQRQAELGARGNGARHPGTNGRVGSSTSGILYLCSITGRIELNPAVHPSLAGGDRAGVQGLPIRQVPGVREKGSGQVLKSAVLWLSSNPRCSGYPASLAGHLFATGTRGQTCTFKLPHHLHSLATSHTLTRVNAMVHRTQSKEDNVWVA